MIDEELYQKAADELNSERRRPHIWARACALANDDHDEARYLYTNLRVEELLAEGGRHAADDDESGGDGGDDSLVRHDELQLEPVEFAPSDDDAAITSARAGVDARHEPLPGAFDEGTLRRPSSVRGELRLDLDENRPLDLDPDDVARLNDADDGPVSAIDGRRLSGADDRDGADDDSDGHEAIAAADALPGGDGDGDGGHGALTLEGGRDGTVDPDEDGTLETDDAGTARSDLGDLDWLDDAYRDERRRGATPPEAGHDAGPADDAFARELERQADELPDERDSGAVVAHAPSTFRGRLDIPSPSTPDETTAAAERGDAEHVLDDGDAPLELEDEGAGGAEYAVFTRPGSRAQAVRQGSSWGALLVTLPWLLYRRLFGTAIVYALFAAVVLGGLLVTGLAWFDAGVAAPLATRVAFGAFALLALAGLVVVPFRRGNHWREDKLERRGFELVAYVRAKGAARARAVAERAVDAAA